MCESDSEIMSEMIIVMRANVENWEREIKLSQWYFILQWNMSSDGETDEQLVKVLWATDDSYGFTRGKTYSFQTIMVLKHLIKPILFFWYFCLSWLNRTFKGKSHADKLRNYERKTSFRLKPIAFVSGEIIISFWIGLFIFL